MIVSLTYKQKPRQKKGYKEMYVVEVDGLWRKAQASGACGSADGVAGAHNIGRLRWRHR